MPPALPRASEDWPQELVCYETDDEIVLIDPFLPQDGSFDPHGKTVRILTQGAHHRGTADGRAVRRISLDTAAGRLAEDPESGHDRRVACGDRGVGARAGDRPALRDADLRRRRCSHPRSSVAEARQS